MFLEDFFLFPTTFVQGDIVSFETGLTSCTFPHGCTRKGGLFSRHQSFRYLVLFYKFNSGMHFHDGIVHVFSLFFDFRMALIKHL